MNELKAELEKLKKEKVEMAEKIQNLESEQNIFNKQKKRFSVNLITLILKLYSDGLNSYQIHRVLIRFKNSLPSMESAVIPSRRYISDLRLSMDCLNKYRELEFVQNAKTLTLSMDESPSSKGDKSFQIGCYNEKGDYITRKDDNIYCNQISETVNKCGEDNIAALTGCLGFIWSTYIAPIWSILSKPLPVKNIKAVVEKAQSMQLSTPSSVIEDLKGIVGVIVILI